MFEIKNLTKTYGEEYALRDVSMTIGKGLNFIIGASGSGKTTLLRIISGMEENYQGEVLYNGKSISTITPHEKAYYYSNIFGFVWQDFNLRDDLTVLENVMLPSHLSGNPDVKVAMKLLRDLKISELAQQKAHSLSGGQKQRVAIARELMKNPRVILADEPTSALDEKSARVIMDILRDIAKTRPVIVVTHNTDLIGSKDHVYELYKGSVTKTAEPAPEKAVGVHMTLPHKLTIGSAVHLTCANIKSGWTRTAITVVSLLVAATLLVATFGGAIADSSQAAFDKLFDTYGAGLLDIELVGSFMSASGTSGNEEDGPSADVEQNIGGLYDQYLSDERVEHIVFTQYFDGIKVTVDGQEYAIDASGNAPTINKLTAGRMPASGNEVVVPQSFATKMGVKDEDLLGKSIDFSGSINNWDSGEPVKMPVSTNATIVGVMDTTVFYDYEGETNSYTIDDAFFFSKPPLDEMRKQAGIEKKSVNFSLRAKTPADMIAIKDELNAAGIVPLGRFELVEDIVRLNEQTAEQSGTASIVIALLAGVIILAVSLVTALMRRREYAIYKVGGFASSHIVGLCATEMAITIAIAAVIFLCASPLVGMIASTGWSLQLLGIGGGLLVACGVLYGVVGTVVGVTVKPVHTLKAVDR